jgi:hypothetical protein
MRKDVHLKALRAASHVAFSVALLGCSSAPATDDQTTADSTQSDLKKKKPCHEDAGPAEPLDCKAVVDAAFPTAGRYPGEKQDVSEEVASCCDTLLNSTDDRFAGTHRWDCCANAAHPDKVGMACTPWGPPVPPPMRRLAALGVA